MTAREIRLNDGRGGDFSRVCRDEATMRRRGVWREEGGELTSGLDEKVGGSRVDPDDLWNPPEIHSKAYTFLVLLSKEAREGSHRYPPVSRTRYIIN